MGTVETTEELTPRELQVLQVLATGLTNRAIGARLFISEGTVRTHVREILGKLGVSSRVEAAVWFAQNAPDVPPVSEWK